MLLLALFRADGVFCVLAVQVRCVAANYAPSEPASLDAKLVREVDIRVFLFPGRDWIQFDICDLLMKIRNLLEIWYVLLNFRSQ